MYSVCSHIFSVVLKFLHFLSVEDSEILQLERGCDYYVLMPIKLRAPQYRDIRPDLKERIVIARANKDEHQKLADAFDEEVLILTKLLDQEERRFGTPKIEESSLPASLSSFVVESLARGKMDKDALKHFAERNGVAADGRSLHATLINLLRTGKIKEVGEGFYDLP